MYLFPISLAYMLKKVFVLNAGDTRTFDPDFKGPIAKR